MRRTVAIYARVSTEHEAQISALENQIQYYDEILKKNPEWELYDRYIDEGITGTSVNKRDNFIRMMDDANNHKFDLIITREVSRFARNTVDTLQQTRVLKTYGVEVWFIEDNIWTMNDEDGELRLSIMATLAQNESKKISSRVKAGQKISFMNGVLYGNGNILGYDKVGKEFVINKEQAETVRRIYDLYLSGYGVRKIQFALEQDRKKTATGSTKWQAGNISRILKNPFYCGRIEYRKQYVPDYLTQKKVNNHGEIEKIIVKGNHQPIVTEEEFDNVQAIFNSKSKTKDDRTYGKRLADNVWSRKLKCKCGHSMNRRINYISKTTGRKTYTFQCYDQLRTGSIAMRQKRGLSIDGICDNKSFPQWKLEVQADFIFRKLLENKQEIYDIAIQMIDSTMNESDDSNNVILKSIEDNLKEIDKYNIRIDNLLDMCADGDISRESFRDKKSNLLQKIKEIESTNEKLKLKIKHSNEQESNNKQAIISDFLKMNVYQDDMPIPDTIIEKYVEEIDVDRDTFTWKLRPSVGTRDFLLMDVTGIKKNDVYQVDTMYDVHCSSGSYKHETLIETPVFIGTYEITRSYFKSVIGYYYDDCDFYFPNKMVVKIELV